MSNNWWKSPVLQGPENDYGDYDYLIEEIPHDYVKWSFDRYASRCDSCGKERHLLLKSAHYFYTYDGYDYMSYDECWMCRLKGKIGSIKHKIKRKIKTFKTTFELHKISAKIGWKQCYKFAKQINR